MKSTSVDGGRWIGRLRRFWSGHNRSRLMLTLALAVMLPAAALICVNVYHLKSIERNKVLEAAIHRDFQQMLAISEKQINHKAYSIVEGLCGQFPSPHTDDEAKEHALDLLLSQHSALAHVFFFDEHGGLILRSQPGQMDDRYFFDEHHRLERQFAGWFSLEGKTMLDAARKKGRHVVWYGERTKRDGRYTYTTTAIFPVPDVAKDKVVLGGVTFAPEYLQRTFFPEMLKALIAYKLSEEGGNRLAMVVYPAESEGDAAAAMLTGVYGIEPFAESAGWKDGKPEVSRDLSDVFDGLALGIKFQETTVAALGHRWITNSLIILGVLSLLLVGGLVLTYRSVSKEVALARLKSDFVSNVSHELRTPLSLIRLYSETLELRRVKGQQKTEEYYAIIRKESERLTALINNILDFSRIEAGRKEYEFRQTDLADLVTNTLDTYRDQIDEQGFTFERSIDTSLPPVHVDREAIARSLVNLVNNALKYSDREKFLGVKLYRADSVVKLEVADRGIGIARNEHSKIFEKFYRAGDPLVHNTKGSGLGLSLVRHIAHAHGGEVDVDSAPGKGSRFTLTLPLQLSTRQPTDDGVRISG